MRIGYVLSNFPPLSETFIRREILALCDLGHEVFVYAETVAFDPRVGHPLHPNLRVREVPFGYAPHLLPAAVTEDAVEHLHGSLMAGAQFASWHAARAAHVPFSITAYSGYSVFTASDPAYYRDLSRDPLCGGIVVEDPFMRDWVVERLGAARERTAVIANSLDLGVYRLERPRAEEGGGRILAVARFVEKKGLVHLVEAFQAIGAARPGWELWLVGGGPEEPRLRHAAAGNPAVRFRGLFTEEECRAAYAAANVFCLPCVRAADGDADGIPTTVLEAMAMQLPVVTSDLLSAPYYVRDRIEGLLAAPGDSRPVAAALDRLCGNAAERRRMGENGRARVAELCDVRRNAARLADLFRDTRRRLWQVKIEMLVQGRSGYSAGTLARYEETMRRTVDFFRPSGRLLEIGCGQGDVRRHLPPGCNYTGCDPLVNGTAAEFPFAAACGENLPFAGASFDGVILYATLVYTLDMERVLEEAARVLKPGGRLHLRECVDDPNEAHLNHPSQAFLLSRLERLFEIQECRADGECALLVNAVKTQALPQHPLVSVVVTAYNREQYVARAIESVRQQNYRPLEIVVVDDGSTDGTAAILEGYRGRIKLVRHAKNRGIAAAKNAGLRATSPQARYVAILDSDDFYGQGFIERTVARLEACPEAGLVYADSIFVDAFGREAGRPEGIEPWSVQEWLGTCNLRGDAWLARRGLVLSTELHDEELKLDVDFDLFYQLLEITTFTHLAEPCVYHTLHGSRASRDDPAMARCHAANLVKYGYSPEYAYLRARRNPEWIPAIEDGIEWGRRMREAREKRRAEEAARLAIEGGKPVRAAYLPFGLPCLGEEEVEEVAATIRSGWIGTGPRVARFEREFAEYVGARHAIALNSCTAGLFLSLVLRGVGPGGEVITTPLTFAATANVIEHVGARPVFADIDPATLNLDPAAVKRAITEKTRAILVVHFGGLPADLDALEEIARRHGVALIEDAAHAVGARYGGRMIGGHGRPVAFSFYANKSLTTGEGGMLTVDDDAEARRLRVLRLHGLSADAWARFHTKDFLQPAVEEPGYKFNMPDLAAALGLPQLRKQETHLARRQEIARRYDEAFADLPVRGQCRPAEGSGARHSLHLYALLLPPERWRVPRDRVIEALRAENIGATVHYRPLHTEPYYRRRYGMAEDALPYAAQAGRTILTLPLSPAMTDRDVEDVVRAFRKVAKNRSA